RPAPTGQGAPEPSALDRAPEAGTQGEAEEEGRSPAIEMSRSPGSLRGLDRALGPADRGDLRKLQDRGPLLAGLRLDPVPGPAFRAGPEELVGLARVRLVDVELGPASPTAHRRQSFRGDGVELEVNGHRPDRDSSHG